MAARSHNCGGTPHAHTANGEVARAGMRKALRGQTYMTTQLMVSSQKASWKSFTSRKWICSSASTPVFLDLWPIFTRRSSARRSSGTTHRAAMVDDRQMPTPKYSVHGTLLPNAVYSAGDAMSLMTLPIRAILMLTPRANAADYDTTQAIVSATAHSRPRHAELR